MRVTNSEGLAASTVVRLIVSPGTITSNLVAHITFDGNYNDSSGRNNNATATGGPTLVAGKFGQAMEFTTTQDGSTIQYATLGYPDDLKFVDTVDFSVSFWANYTQSVDDPPFISNKNWASSGNRGWGIFTQAGGNYRVNTTGTGGTKYDTSATPVVRDGTWHNILLSHARGAIVSVYTDGVLTLTKPDLTTGNVDTDDLGYSVNIGQDGQGNYTDGGSAGITNALIDDVGIWRRALSSQEASAIYTAGQRGDNLALAVVAPIVAPILSAHLSGGNIVINWQGSPTLKLQKTIILNPASWSDVSGTLGASTATVPITGAALFFKLAQ